MANTREQPIVIQSSKIPADVTYYPLLITRDHLDDEVVDPSGGDAARTDGGDIRIYSSVGGSGELAREIVKFEHDSVTSAGDADIQIRASGSGWVISAVGDTTIYLQYGDGSLTDYAEGDTYGKHAVYDSNYIAFYALEEDPSGTPPQIIDSTSSSFDGTSNGGMTSGDSVAAQISNGLDFDGSDDFISCGDNADIRTNDMTLEYWGYRVGGSKYQGAISKHTWDSASGRWFSGVDNNDKMSSLLGGNSGAFGWATSGASISASTWTYMAATYDRTGNITNYINASSDGIASISSFSSEDLTISSTLKIGSMGAAGTTDTGFNFWDGRVDAPRISNALRTPNWLTVVYNNESNPSTFATAGTPYTVSSGASVLINGGLVNNGLVNAGLVR